MNISFVRSGGFAGMQTKFEVDTESLPAEEAAEWERLVEESGFFELPEAILPSTAGADRFQYLITIKRGPQQHRVETADGAVPASLQPLLDRLIAAARQKRA